MINENDFSTTWLVYFDLITVEFVELPAPPQPYRFWERKTLIFGLGVFFFFCMAHGCESEAEVELGFFEVFVMGELLDKVINDS